MRFGGFGDLGTRGWEDQSPATLSGVPFVSGSKTPEDLKTDDVLLDRF